MDVLSVNLNDILGEINDTSSNLWCLLYLNATANLEDGSILDLEREVNNSRNGVRFDWTNLKAFANQIIQGIDMVLIGDKVVEHLKRYPTDAEMQVTCRYVIELVDSSYWLVHSHDMRFIQRLLDNLPGVEESLS